MGNMASDYKKPPLTEDQHSVNLSKMGGTYRNTGIGSKLRSTMHTATKQLDRVEKFATVRDNAVQIAVDIQSRHIVRDFKEKGRVKNHKEYQEEMKANALKKKIFYDERSTTVEEKFTKSMKQFDQKAYAAYKKEYAEYNTKLVEDKNKMVHASVISHTQLKAHMAHKEQKRAEMEELIDNEAVESKNHLLTLESNIQDKARRQ